MIGTRDRQMRMTNLRAMPLYWRNETSGLPAAIGAYLDNRIHGTSMSAEEVGLVRAYLVQWIDAPGWENNDTLWDELIALRIDSRALNSPEQIQSWLREALEIGIDPL